MDGETGSPPKRIKLDQSEIKIIHITEIKRNGRSGFFSLDGFNVSNSSQST